MAVVYFSNTFDIINGNVWVDISDYIVADVNVAITERNESFTPLTTSHKLTITYQTETAKIPQIGDRVKIEFGTFGYFGYVDYVDTKEDKGIIEIFTNHYLSRLKDYNMNNPSFFAAMTADPYGDNITKDISGNTYLGYNLRTIIGTMIKTACPDLFVDIPITGPFFQWTFGSTVLGDFFQKYYQDSAMLQFLGHEKCGQLYKTQDEYTEDPFTFFDFVSFVCKITETNIYTYHIETITFFGNITDFDNLDNLATVNNRFSLPIVDSSTIQRTIQRATESKLFKYTQTVTNYMLDYYASPIEDVLDKYTLPKNKTERTLKRYTDLGMPESFLLRYDYYTESSALMNDTDEDYRYFIPFANNNFILPFRYYTTDGMSKEINTIQKQTLTVLGVGSGDRNYLNAKYSLKNRTTKITQNTILDLS